MVVDKTEYFDEGMVVLVDEEMMKQGRMNDVKLVLVTTK